MVTRAIGHICTWKMFKAILFFAAGLYAGIFADQRYKIPNVADPHALLAQLKETLEKYKKDDSKKDS